MTDFVLRGGTLVFPDREPEKKDVLVIPERLVTFEDGGKKATVEMAGSDPKKPGKKVEIKTGISDGLNVEVMSGLKKGDRVVERPPKEIS